MRLANISEDDEDTLIMILGPAAITLSITMITFFSMPSPTLSTPSKLPEAIRINQSTILIEDFTFNPNFLQVQTGSTVVWTNKDTVQHSITADDGSFATGILDQAESGSVNFITPRTYSYHCRLHPFIQGTVVVL